MYAVALVARTILSIFSYVVLSLIIGNPIHAKTILFVAFTVPIILVILDFIIVTIKEEFA